MARAAACGGFCRADCDPMGHSLPPSRSGPAEPSGTPRPRLAPLLRFNLLTHPVQGRTMLKLLKNFRPDARAFTNASAESAGSCVSLCRAEP